MELGTILYIGGFTIVLVAAIAFIVAYFKSNVSKGTIENYQQSIDSLTKRVETLHNDLQDCTKKHVESTKSIANLQGQINVLRDIPLSNIKTGIDSLITINGKVLDRLKATAKIAAEDRGILTETSQHIEKQDVDMQIINNKKTK